MNVLTSALRWLEDGAKEIVAASDYAFAAKDWPTTGLLLSLATVSVVGLPAVLGYVHRCIKESVRCCGTPPAFDRPADDFAEGLKIGLLGLYYFVIIVIAVGYLFTNVVLPVGPAPTGHIEADLGLFAYYGSLVLLMMVVLFVLFFTNAWLRYATRGDFVASLNPLFALEWVLRYPTIVAGNFVLCCAIALLAAVASVVVVTIPWAASLGLVACACVTARSYVRDTENGDPIVGWALRAFRAKVPHDHPLLSRDFDQGWSPEKDFYRLPVVGTRVPGLLVEWPRFYALSRLSHTLRSLKYALSNGHQVFWGGLIAITSGVLVGTPLLFGYLSRCLRETLHGAETMPGFDGKVRMYGEGLLVSALSVEYFLLTWLLFALISPLFNVPALSGIYVNLFGRWVVTNVHVLLPAALHAFLFSVFFNNAWLRYAITGRLLPSMNPVSMAGWMLTYPEIIFNNMMSTGLLGLLLVAPGFLIFTLPWVTFVGFVANAFIRGESFEKLTATGGIRQSPVVKGLVKVVVPGSRRDD